MEWLGKLPTELRQKVELVIKQVPSLKEVFDDLYKYATEDPAKRRKVSVKQESSDLEFNDDSGIIHLSTPIDPQTIIMDIQQVLFQHPVRKRMNFVFHLLEREGEPIPALLVVSPTTDIPEFTAVNLDKTIKLAILLPIVGNTTLPKKKNLASLCLWIDPARMGSTYLQKGGEPIICQINLEQIKKVLVKAGKMPNNIEQQYDEKEENDVYLHPIQEHIVNYFTRQFGLCGIQLKNYLPCKDSNVFNLNTDQALAIAPVSNPTHNVLIMTDCYKGSKDGVLVFLDSGTFIFGFKKPILLFDVLIIKFTSYTNVTRMTFSLNITVEEDGVEKTHEFLMIDQQYFAVIDDFIKNLQINDALFDAKLKEKRNADGDNGKPVNAEEDDDDDDDEEDGDFVGGEIDADVAEEYDSEHDSDGVLQEGVEEDKLEN